MNHPLTGGLMREVETLAPLPLAVLIQGEARL